jgi:hypothetical protein
MALFIELAYSKKLGLPGYSSHQCGVTVRTEITNLTELEKTTADLYGRLQAAVDAQIVNPGHVPQESGPTRPGPSGNGAEAPWKCSDKQRELILKLVNDQDLAKADVEALAQQRFGTGVKELNKLQASALIDELLETPVDDRRQGHRRQYTGRGR